MPTALRIATFNLENLDDKPGLKPTLAERIPLLRPALDRVRADLLCLQEVHGQEHAGQPRDLAALQTLIATTPYQGYHVAHTTTQAGQPFDVRNLVVLSRFPILARRQLMHDLTPPPAYRQVTAIPAEPSARDVTWERPALYLRIDLGNNRQLHVTNLHLKSKIPTDISGQKRDQYSWKTVAGWAEGYFLSALKRVGQALEVRILVDQIFDTAQAAGEDALIAVCGDLNSESDAEPVQAIRGSVEETGNPDLTTRVLVPCENSVPESSRYSLLHLGHGQMLDHILVSRPLLAFYRGTEIHNEVLPDESGAFRDDTKFPESDHAPVVAEFVLP